MREGGERPQLFGFSGVDPSGCRSGEVICGEVWETTSGGTGLLSICGSIFSIFGSILGSMRSSFGSTFSVSTDSATEVAAGTGAGGGAGAGVGATGGGAGW